jgi:uncharacterized protein
MMGELGVPEMELLLREEVIGRIGCHARGRTYVVPVTYVFDGTSIIGHTGNGLKVRMMRENPLVCFEVEQLRDLPSWRSVIAHGRFEELHGEEAAAALQVLVERLRTLKQSQTAVPGHGMGVSVPPGEQSSPRQSIIYAIRLYEMTGRYELAR